MAMDQFTKNALWDYWKEGDDHEVLTNEAFSDPNETYKDGEHKIAKIFRIETDIYLFTHDIQGAKTYEEYENKLNNDPKELWSENRVPYELIDHICESFHFKNGKTKWPTCSSNEDGFCNVGKNDEEAIREERKPNDDHGIDNFDNDLVRDSTT
ncbi:hypothetical protein Tco_0799810 [Tanacetum coccineum]|uniref:Uncharacterized protein n=1 Tax=Tanacetum coccineum TaxID=301880 RepID=A0ABQ4ZUM1_9ASTR